MTQEPNENGNSPKIIRYRSRTRILSHQQADVEAHFDPIPPVLEHPLVPSHEPVLIRTKSDLQQLIADLQTARQFGYDSEFIGEHSYYPKLCLIQVSTVEQVSIIDTQADLDLMPFWDLLADPDTQTIVHCGLQDLEPVWRHLGRTAQSIIDTQVAAAFTGLVYPCGLARLVQDLLGADLGREMKFTQWDQRPLSSRQIQYAANDVRYLPALWAIITQKLDDCGNTNWALEECRSLSDQDLYRFNPDALCRRMQGTERMTPTRLRLLRELICWREEAAREQDVPPRTLVKDRVLADLARFPVHTIDDLDGRRGFPRPIKRFYGRAIVTRTQTALNHHDAAPRRRHPPVLPDLRAALDSLWESLKRRCEERKIDPTILTNKRELAYHLHTLDHGHHIDPLETTRLDRGWRKQFLPPTLDEWQRR